MLHHWIPKEDVKRPSGDNEKMDEISEGISSFSVDVKISFQISKVEAYFYSPSAGIYFPVSRVERIFEKRGSMCAFSSQNIPTIPVLG